MDRNFWEQACNATVDRPVSELKQSNYIANAVAIFVCAFGAVFSATFFLLDYRLLLWRRSGEKSKEIDGDRVWKDLRLFSGWMCAGCLAGVVTFCLFLSWRNFEYDSVDMRMSRNDFYRLEASLHQCLAAFNVVYPVYLLCVIFAMNTLLRRVSDHASHSYYNTARDLVDPYRSSTVKRFDWRDCIGQYALYYWVRNMHVIAMVLCSLNIAARIVAAGFTAELARLYDSAAAATDFQGKETDASRAIFKETQDEEKTFRTPIAVASIIQAATLFFVSSGFLLFFPASIVMFRRVERKMEALLQELHLRTDVGTAFLPFEFSPVAADGSETQNEMPIADARQYMRDLQSSAAAQRWRFVFCLVFVTLALLALTSNAVFTAISYADTARNPLCGICAECQSVRYIMVQWLIFTPEFFSLTASLSTMLPLIFSLWMMTTPEDRELLMHPSRFLSEEISLHPVESERERELKAHRIRMGIELE